VELLGELVYVRLIPAWGHKTAAIETTAASPAPPERRSKPAPWWRPPTRS